MVVEPVKVIIEVVAGVIPGKPEPEFTRRYPIRSWDWKTAGEAGVDEQMVLLAETNGKALAYAGLLMQQPHRLNWVKTEWIWL